MRKDGLKPRVKGSDGRWDINWHDGGHGEDDGVSVGVSVSDQEGGELRLDAWHEDRNAKGKPDRP